MSSTEVKQAYLRSAEKSRTDIFIKPPKEINLNLDELLLHLKPLYGLSESSSYWGNTFRGSLERDLG